MEKSRPTRRRGTRWLGITIVFVVLVGSAFLGGTRGMARAYDNRIFPGVSVSSIPLGGKTPEEARAILEHAVNEWNRHGIVVSALGKRVVITNSGSAISDLDPTGNFFSFDVATNVRRAMAVGRDSDPFFNVLAGVQGLVYAKDQQPALEVNRAALEKTLAANFLSLERSAKNAQFTISIDGTLHIEPEEVGRKFNYESAERDMTAAFANFQHPEVPLVLTDVIPSVHVVDLERVRPQAEALLRTLPRALHLRRDGEEFASILLPQASVASWVTVRGAADGAATIDLRDDLSSWIAAVAKPYEQEPKEARFLVKDDHIFDFQESSPGWQLDRHRASASLRSALLESGTGDITIDLTRVELTMSTKETNPLGIHDLLGVGTSNFKGSPKNRRHNIATGMAKLNGIIIPAGEEFSLGKTLGRIEEDTEYLPELVIKGDKTIPEFGGGLCQIGTTTFRAAMAAGLPVTERQSHSYRVRYYEPAGTDATIYPPKPDLKFTNDTGNPIVLITKMQGDDLRFELWGVSDGRKAERTDPKISNIVKPAPMKTIESEDLKPGEKKCTEIAHDGADAVFTYTVTMPDGTKRERVFKSHYKPWQAVCLIGVAKKEKTLDGAAAAPTPELPPPPDIPRVMP